MSTEETFRCTFEKDKLLLRLDLTFLADTQAITPVVDRVMELAGEMSCSKGKEFEIEAALREALVNAIVHGCKKDPSKTVQLTVCCDESRGILLVVRDPGSGFDIDSIQSPVMGDNIFSHGGRGIFLINQLMDEVRFLGRGTEIHMLKR
jgi:serine/threonine-protein kinase RsbW